MIRYRIMCNYTVMILRNFTLVLRDCFDEIRKNGK